MAKKTYIGIDKFDPIEYTDWAKIGEDFNKKVDAEVTRRQTLIKSIEDANREVMDNAINQPKGNFQAGNEWLSHMTDQLIATMTMQNKAWEKGLVKQREYTEFLNNAKTSSEAMITLRDSMEDYFSKLDPETTSGESLWEAEQIEGLAQFGKSMPVMDTMTGLFNLSEKIVNEDGTITAGKTLSANEMKFFMGRIYERYDLLSEAKKATDKLGQVTTAAKDLASRYGQLDTIITTKDKKDGVYQTEFDDAEKDIIGGYMEWEDNYVKSIMSNPHAAASIGSEFLDMTFTYNKDEVDGNTIFKNRANEAQPEFTEDQNKKIGDTIKRYLRASISVEQEIKSVGRKPYPPDYGKPKPTQTNKLSDDAYHMELLRTGNAQQRAAAEEYWMKRMNATEFKVGETAITYTPRGGAQQTIPIGRSVEVDGEKQFQVFGQRDFFTTLTPALAGRTDALSLYNEAQAQGYGLIDGKTMPTIQLEGTGASQAVSTSPTEQSEFKKSQMQNQVAKKIDAAGNPFVKKATKGAVDDILSVVSQYGGTVEPIGKTKVKVTIGEIEQQYEVDTNDAETVKRNKSYLQNQILNGTKLQTFIDLYDRLTTEQRQEAGIKEVPTTQKKENAY
jgi:hypothetical protein